MARDRSMPATVTPRAASGSATRPVPMASSSAGPSPASSASTSMVAAISAAENSSSVLES